MKKLFSEKALAVKTTSRRFQAGTRRNKKLKMVGTFKSDRSGR